MPEEILGFPTVVQGAINNPELSEIDGLLSFVKMIDLSPVCVIPFQSPGVAPENKLNQPTEPAPCLENLAIELAVVLFVKTTSS